MIELWLPTSAELLSLRNGTTQLRGAAIVAGALPPKPILDQGRYFGREEGLIRRWSNPYVIYLQEEAVIAGSIGGKGLLAGETEVELGYNVAQAYRRRGIATAAIAVLTDRACEDGLRLVAHVEPANEGSIRALEANGYRRECTLRLPDSLDLYRYRLAD